MPILLGLLAACAILMSVFPWPLKLALAVAAIAYGAWLERRERGRPLRVLDFDGDPRLDGVVLRDARVELHGPWLTLLHKDAAGRWRHETWWLDPCRSRLDVVNRRRLRLVVSGERHMLSPPMLAP